MQVTETSAAGLKREYRVVVPATDLEAKVNERLDDLKGRVQLRGFRPGKVPVAHLKRLYGKSAMAEVIEAAVREANSARSSPITVSSSPPSPRWCCRPRRRGRGRHRGQVRPRLHGRDGDRAGDRARRFQDASSSTRLTAEVTDDEIDQALQTHRRAEPAVRRQEPKARPRAIASPSISKASIDGTPFEGGTGEDVPLVLGCRSIHSRLRGPSRRAQGRRKQDLRRQIPRRLSRRPIWPAKTRPLPSPSRRWKRRAR